MKENTTYVAEIMKKCVLCRGMDDEEVRAFCEEGLAAGMLRMRSVNKGEYVFHEGAAPRALYILASGRIAISRVTMSGRSILVEEIEQRGDMFGEVYLFLGMPYKICTQAAEDSEIIVMSGELFSQAYGRSDSGARGTASGVGVSERAAFGYTDQKCAAGSENADDAAGDTVGNIMVRNMLALMAQKAYMLSGRIQVLASPSIREKAARFILEREQPDGTISAEMSREAMADYMGVTRPSLSRELSKMQADGLIKIDGRRIVVSDQDGLEGYL